MAKTRKLLIENIKLIDVVIEILDARIPFSSKNPDFENLAGNKPGIIALNKSDLADPNMTKPWLKWYKNKGHECIEVNSISGKGFNEVKKSIKKLVADKMSRYREKGIVNKSIRTMVVGIPNVGKSSFINKLAGRSSAKTGDKPGVTRGKQWIKIQKDIDLLDTPGMLWPKIKNKESGLNLAYTGAVKDEVYDTIEAAALFLTKIKDRYPELLNKRYKVIMPDAQNGMELLEITARKRGCLLPGGEVDFTRISSIVLDEFRSGRIGAITLESPQEVKNE